MSLVNYDKLKEECAVFGVSMNTNEAIGTTYNGLLSLQHRGQEGAGIAFLQDRTILTSKGSGLVSEVFSIKKLNNLPKCNVAIGHTRYSTTGDSNEKNIQPFVTEFLTGRLATAHNGNITNAKEIKDKLLKEGLNFVASSDSEVLSSLIAFKTLKEGNILDGIKSAVKEVEGAFSLLVLTDKNQIIAVRDKFGFRPFCIGKNERGLAISSESCALDTSGFKFIRDIKPGEMIVVENSEIIFSKIILQSKKQSLCIFEHVYFARPDSVIDNLSVYEARVNMGRILAKENKIKADIVCGVPESGLCAAIGYSLESKIPEGPCFIKNKYIGRSFIYPTQTQRESAVQLKLNPLATNVKDKKIILIDDSIVRGTTCAKIIKSLRNAGAKEIHMMISSPPFIHTCHFGTDIGDENNLIYNNYSIEEIRKKIDADSLSYISLDGLLKACEGSTLDFCCGCFTGKYSVDVKKISKEILEC